MMKKPSQSRLKALAIISAITLFFAFFAPFAVQSPPAAAASSDGSGEIRVLLRSLGTVNALQLTLAGSYTLDGDPGFRFDRGTVITVAASASSIYMRAGGLFIDMGATMTLTRHQADGENGIFIHGSQKDNLYRGHLSLSADNGNLVPVMVLDIEEYLYGVVPYEMSDSFPLEALKAQAVAARTYALRRMERNATRNYHVVDTTQDQVYKGFDPNCERAILAVNETRGLVGMYEGGYATCYYAASNGGQTALANDIWGGTTNEYDYLDIRDDPYDLENPESIERSYITSADGKKIAEPLLSMLRSQIPETLAARGYSDDLNDFEIVRVLNVEAHTPRFEGGSRMYSLIRFDLSVRARPMQPVFAPPPTPEPTHDEEGNEIEVTPEPDQPEPTPIIVGYAPGEWELAEEPVSVDITTYEQVKGELGLKINGSNYELYSVEAQPQNAPPGEAESFAIFARRFGHGVGMSQRGAQWMAKQYEMSHRDILTFYYPGMTLEEKSLTQGGLLPDIGSMPSSMGAARPRATPRPTQAPLPALTGAEYYATVTLTSKASALNVRDLPSLEGKVVAVLYDGERMVVKGTPEEGWAQIVTAEFEGYVSIEFITAE